MVHQLHGKNAGYISILHSYTGFYHLSATAAIPFNLWGPFSVNSDGTHKDYVIFSHVGCAIQIWFLEM